MSSVAQKHQDLLYEHVAKLAHGRDGGSFQPKYHYTTYEVKTGLTT
jgi:hypothetical protein